MNKTIVVDGVTYQQQTSTGPWSYWQVEGGWIFIGKDGGEVEGKQIINSAYVLRKYRGGKGIGDIATKNAITLDNVNGDIKAPLAKIIFSSALPYDWTPVDA